MKVLDVSSSTLDAITVAEELFPCLPLFHNLNRLVVGCGKSLKLPYRALLKILHNSPHLESIYFGLEICLSMLSAREGWHLDPVPSCFLTHLKRIEFEWFLGDKEEVNSFKTIVKSARVLEEIFVFVEKKSKRNVRNVILDLLEECMKSNVAIHIL